MKRKIIKILLSIIILVVLLTLIINIYMIKTTELNINKIDELKSNDNYDAVLILGCLAYENGPSLMLSKRLDKGIEVYNIIHTKILLSGDHGRNDYDEVNIMRDYLLGSNIDSKDIFLDHAGFNTYDSIYRAKYVFGAEKIIIVTQKYHMYRALYIAKALGLDAVGVVADDIPYKSIMLKNEIREVLSRDKNFFKAIFKPKSKYIGEPISLNQDGIITSD